MKIRRTPKKRYHTPKCRHHHDNYPHAIARDHLLRIIIGTILAALFYLLDHLGILPST